MELRRVSEDRWECSDDRYAVRLERDPWDKPEAAKVPMFVVDGRKWGPTYLSPLRTVGTLSDALEYIRTDASSPVFDEFGMCRWCDMSRLDLAAAPRWWFGCNLCESAIEQEEILS
jgi:hypothetical protein